MLEQLRYHSYFDAAVDILCLRSLIDLNYHLTSAYHLHTVWAWFWVTCFLSEAKMLLPSDKFHQPWSGWPWWSMMLHQQEKQNELLFFNLGPFQDFFFIIRCTTTQQISADTLSELSFSCHLRSPAGSSGGSAAINDFFGHLEEGVDEFMLLSELTNVSARALVALAY